VKRRSAAEGVSSLADHSIGLILDHQAPSGAYPAAPHYPTYRYSWIRDGAFIAYAMDLHGQHHSAQAFHRWVARTVARHAHKVDLLEARPDDRSPAESDRLQVLDDQYVLHTRYTLDGQEAGQEWGNFQPDGYGYWLTALSHHLKVTNGSVDEYREAIATVARYLGLTWDLPCYDCWEEYPTRRHSTTWAAISAGLRHAAELIDDPSAVALADTIMGQLLEHGTHAHTLTKFINLAEDAPPTRTNPITPPAALAGNERVGKNLAPDTVDASDLLVLGALGPFPREHPVVSTTLARVEAELCVGGGVHRYLEDEYYGGGLWPLLAGALAAAPTVAEDPPRVGRVMGWLEGQVDAEGNLPEQVPTHLRRAEHYELWVQRWGPIARPLLWAHAMYLIAKQESSW